MSKSIHSLSGAFRARGTIVGLLAFPVLASLTYALCAYGFHRLSPSAQNAIEHGAPGMLLGIFGGGILIGAACATWLAAEGVIGHLRASTATE